MVSRHRTHISPLPSPLLGKDFLLAFLFFFSLPSTTRGDDHGIAKNSLLNGCLYSKLPDHQLPLRVCNSEDATDAIEKGVCRPPEFDYLEIRIKCQVRDRKEGPLQVDVSFTHVLAVFFDRI